MKLRPILFSTPMVMALLAGRKKQTRRIVKLPKWSTQDWEDFTAIDDYVSIICESSGCEAEIDCPYGQPGDVLWVRESLQIFKRPGLYEAYRYADGEVRVWEHERPEYDEGATVKIDWSKVKKTPSIHVPKKYCRLFLQIKSVRVERLQDITEADAIAEGIEQVDTDRGGAPIWKNYEGKGIHIWMSPVNSYQSLWEKINGPESWEVNPWVWVVEFERIEKPIV
jgi:hypothetical protein